MAQKKNGQKMPEKQMLLKKVPEHEKQGLKGNGRLLWDRRCSFLLFRLASRMGHHINRKKDDQ